ncbi:MAG: formylglycine-generating enzyme family protein [Alkalinema sp. RU_4_3]|nr:formylglycine-generating enzyme family protein [Alkalinema sp. RU_4_3]
MDSQERERAKQKLALFVRQFGTDETIAKGYEQLAYHAALPMVLTPELVHYLRVEFVGTVPWEAEADLLLSDLCSTVGYELYAMNSGVRCYLLETMKLPKERQQRLAKVLLNYLGELSRLNPNRRSQEIQAQRFAALVCSGEAGVRQMVAEMLACFEQVGSEADRAKVVAQFARLAQIVREMEPQLESQPEFVGLMRTVNQAVRSPQSLTQADRQRLSSVEGLARVLLQEVVESDVPQVGAGMPELKTFDFEVAEYREGELGRSHPPLQPADYEFEVATIAIKRKKVQIDRRTVQGTQYVEALASELALELVKLPGGTFSMGAPEEELGAYSDEKPAHGVTLPGFYMGKYAVTQVQWRFVAEAIDPINIELDPNPSHFEGDDLPVEQVSWLDAIEFCDRLSAYTGREYRLPTEAEWEYACRGGTTTAFHFGETIDAEVANYRAQDWTYEGNTYPGKYGSGQLGEYREKTIAVGSLNAANEFGIHDMHGNVWEWCMDHWHDNYDEAPIDGSAWVDGDREKDADRLLRGGSWDYDPRNCRSAFRNHVSPDDRDYDLGFRVVCVFPAAARILP